MRISDWISDVCSSDLATCSIPMIRRCRQPAGAWNSASGCPVAPPRQPRAIPDLIPDFRPFLMSVREKDPVVVVGAGIVGVCCALYLLRDAIGRASGRERVCRYV